MTNEIVTVLEDIRHVILSGDYGRLADLVPALEDAESQLGSCDLQQAMALKAQADRTASCLQGAMSGLKSARRRVAEIDDAARGLTTYDRNGAKATLPCAPLTSRRI
ncbi:MAG: hypothetical protein JXR75_01620 [Rhodobacteraceae bacterium]|nr:hypothetical protein [Paracoccaceae bacterium]